MLEKTIYTIALSFMFSVCLLCTNRFRGDWI